jgi:ribonuclease HII
MKVTMKSKPSFNEEQLLWGKGYEYVAGIDEVGRGAFAGPVVAGIVIFSKDILTRKDPPLYEINDSKLLHPKKRKELAIYIKNIALFSEICAVPVSIINKIGVGKASYLAFRRLLSAAQARLETNTLYALVDGFHIPYVRGVNKKSQKPIVKGDRLSVSIAAASIIAKVYRDNLMNEYHHQYKIYNFIRNKGYGTKFHRDVIKVNGLCKLHRTSFDLEKFLPITSKELLTK